MSATKIESIGGNWRGSEKTPHAPAVLTPGEARAAAAVLEHGDQATAAKAAGLSLRTLQRFVTRPHVRDAIAAGALERLRRVTVAIARHAERAPDVLGDVIDGKATATSPRVRACTAMIEAALRVRAAEDQEQRLLHLEAQIARLLGQRGIE